MVTSIYPTKYQKTGSSYLRSVQKSIVEPAQIPPRIFFIEEYVGESVQEMPAGLVDNETPAVSPDEFEVIYNWFLS